MQKGGADRARSGTVASAGKVVPEFIFPSRGPLGSLPLLLQSAPGGDLSPPDTLPKRLIKTPLDASRQLTARTSQAAARTEMRVVPDRLSEVDFHRTGLARQRREAEPGDVRARFPHLKTHTPSERQSCFCKSVLQTCADVCSERSAQGSVLEQHTGNTREVRPEKACAGNHSKPVAGSVQPSGPGGGSACPPARSWDRGPRGRGAGAGLGAPVCTESPCKKHSELLTGGRHGGGTYLSPFPVFALTFILYTCIHYSKGVNEDIFKTALDCNSKGKSNYEEKTKEAPRGGGKTRTGVQGRWAGARATDTRPP